MSVIMSRALPDVRDGLKPVHRRILYSMDSQNLRPDRPHAKCAKVVGEVMGTYHPHGDMAIYDALVRMVQDFSLRHPLIDGHGNFGGTGPDEGPAAMRYTECRLAPLALELLAGIDEDTVDFVANYDGSNEEPVVLPARFPNLLVNGSQGIAVGMATNIPPHNLGEVIDATLHVIANPDATSDDLMQFVKGPDFPTGATILGRQGILDAYRTGKGSVKMRAVAEIEESRGTTRIVVTEFPYQTSVEVVEKKIADLVHARELDGISRTQNDSAGRQARLVIELKRDANANVVLNNLYKHTPMQTSFGVNVVALVDGVPRTLSLAQCCLPLRGPPDRSRHPTVRVPPGQGPGTGRTSSRGCCKAIDMLDAVIAAIRGSDDRPAARDALMAEPFSFSEDQAIHILDMTLGRLTRLGRRSSRRRWPSSARRSPSSRPSSATRPSCRGVISEELPEIKNKYANHRRTSITHDPGEMGVEDLIEDEELVVTMTRAGYIKAVSGASFRTQGRGGRGVQGARLKEEDLVAQLVHTSAHAYLLLFSNRGRVYRLRAHEVPMKERTARGTAVVNLLPLAPDETIQAIVATRDFDSGGFLTFATKARPGEEDRLHRVRQVPPGGLHRHCAARRRRTWSGSWPPRGTTTW